MLDLLNIETNIQLSLQIFLLFLTFYLILTFYTKRHSKNNAIFRIFILFFLMVLIINPTTNKEKPKYQKNIVLLVSDKTLSVSETNKTSKILKAKKQILVKLKELSNYEIKNLEISNYISSKDISDKETYIFEKIKKEVNFLNKEKISGIIIFTDGQIFDKPEIIQELNGIPIHFVVVGNKNEKDRVIITEGLPDYALVGEKIIFSLKILSWEKNQKIETNILLDGKTIIKKDMETNKFHEIEFPIQHSGENILEIKIENDDKEITLSNNYKIKRINGIHDRLRVMLISGEPNMGLRTLRNILNSDPSIELVHFTILRPPSKRDLTPVQELSLIPFPTQELFAADISKFSLIIFDQYSLQEGVLPEKYINNITNFVLDGGAFLDIASSKYINKSGILNSPIKKILPSYPISKNSEESFIPKLTEIGKRHPITKNLSNNYQNKSWGKWYRYTVSEKIFGKTLMQYNNNPLMIVSKAGEGRVAQILSDHSWLWMKSFKEEGPLVGLLRNTIHWLLKAPELEEDHMIFDKINGEINIQLNTLTKENILAKVVYPSEKETEVMLKNDGEGLLKGSFKSNEKGKHVIYTGKIKKIIYPSSHDIKELEKVNSTATKINEFKILNSNISINWANDKIPKLTKIYNNNIYYGKNWVGLIERKVIKDNFYKKENLLPWYFFLPSIIFLFLLVWYRESKN